MLFRIVLCVSCALVFLVVGLRLWQEHLQMVRDEAIVSQLQGDAWAVYPKGPAFLVQFQKPEQVNDASIPLILKLKSVQKLFMSNTKITDHGFLELVRMPRLLELWVDGTGLTEPAIGEFKRQRPDVDLVR